MQVWAYGAVGNDIIVRVGHEHHAEAPARPGARPFDMTGRPMTGWVQVGPEGFATDAELARWVAQGVAFAQTLPPK